MTKKRADDLAVGAMLVTVLLFMAGVCFALGAAWHAWVQAPVVPVPVEVPAAEQTVTAQTVAPAVPAEVQP